MKKIFLVLSLLAAPHLVGDVFASSIYDAVKASSPFPACKSTPMIGKSDYLKNKDFWDHAMKDCHVNLEVLPDTGFFNTMISKLDEEGRTGSDAAFLTAVGKRALQYVIQNNTNTRNLIACARNEKDWLDKNKLTKASCDALEHQVMSAAGSVRESFRFNRILMEGGSFEFFRTHPNEAWKSSFGETAPDSTEAPTAEEIRKMSAAYSKDHKECADAWARNPDSKTYQFNARSANYGLDKSDNFFTACYSEKQVKYRVGYLADLSKAPILAFLGQKNPNPEQVALAAQKLLMNGLKEQQKILNALGDSNTEVAAYNIPVLLPIPFVVPVGSRPKTADEKAKALLRFMKYGPVVNELLHKSPGECKVATGLANYIENTNMRNDVGLMVGMIGAAFVAPEALGAAGVTGTLGAGTVGTLAALPVAGYMSYQNVQNANDARERNYNAMVTDGKLGHALGDVKEYEQAKSSVILDLAMFPLNFIGIGGAKFVNGRMVEAAENLFKSEKAAESLTALLETKGMAKPEIETTIAHLRSGKPDLIESAANKVIKTLDLDPNEIALVQAVQNGLGTKNERWARMALKMMPKDAKDRQAVVKEAIAIFDKMNPAKFNDITRPKAVEAAFAAANFGIKDPARIASALTEWDGESVEGLTRAYKLAAQKMKSPDYLKIASVEERQQKAFDSALEDLMKDKPEFASMSAAERAKAKGEMCTCAACKL